MAVSVPDRGPARSHRSRSCRAVPCRAVPCRWLGPVRRQVDLRRPKRVMTLASVGCERLRHAGHELVDWVADYRLKVASLPVRSPVAPGEVAAALATSPPGGA